MATDSKTAALLESEQEKSLAFSLSSSGERQIARAAGLVMAFFLVSKVAGVLRTIITSTLFGTTGALDAYLAAFRLPDLIFQLVAGGALASAFIPTYSTYLARGDREKGWQLASAVANLLLVVVAAVGLVAAIFALPLVQYVIAPGFTPVQQALTASLLRYLLISTAIFSVSGLVMGILNAHQHFFLPALAPVLYNVAIILAAWFWHQQYSVASLVFGVIIGAILHFAIQLPGLYRLHFHYYPILSLRDAAVRKVMKLMAPRVAGLAAVQLTFLVNTILASDLPTGSLAALNYAFLLMLLPQGIFAQAVGTAAFPTFAAQVARGEMDAMRRAFQRTLSNVLFLTLPATAILFVFRYPIIQVLLQHRAFDAHSTAMTAYALAFFSLGLCGHSAVEILARAFYAMHDTATPVAISIGAMALTVLLSLWLVHPMLQGGLALATSIGVLLEMSVSLLFLSRRLHGLGGKALAVSAGQNALAALLMGVTAWLVLRALPTLSPWWSATVGLLLSSLLYFGLAYLLGSNEARFWWHISRAKLFRRAEK